VGFLSPASGGDRARDASRVMLSVRERGREDRHPAARTEIHTAAYLRPANLRVKWNWPAESGGFVCRTLNVTVPWTWDDGDI